MKHSFIGELIEGEQYELFNGDIVTLTKVDQHFIGAYVTERGTGKMQFEVMTPDTLRRKIKDIY